MCIKTVLLQFLPRARQWRESHLHPGIELYMWTHCRQLRLDGLSNVYTDAVRTMRNVCINMEVFLSVSFNIYNHKSLIYYLISVKSYMHPFALKLETNLYLLEQPIMCSNQRIYLSLYTPSLWPDLLKDPGVFCHS